VVSNTRTNCRELLHLLCLTTTRRITRTFLSSLRKLLRFGLHVHRLDRNSSFDSIVTTKTFRIGGQSYQLSQCRLIGAVLVIYVHFQLMQPHQEGAQGFASIRIVAGSRTTAEHPSALPLERGTITCRYVYQELCRYTFVLHKRGSFSRDACQTRKRQSWLAVETSK
jgi:hypothetical protein